MPTYRPRVSMPALEGTYERILSSSAFENQFTNQANASNSALLGVCWISLLADSPVDPLKPFMVINRFVVSIETDILSLIRSYSAAFDRLANSVKLDEAGVVIIDDMYDFFRGTPIFREYVEFRRTQSTSAFQFISTFLLFGKKMLYVDGSLDAVALRKWLEVEDRLGKVEAPTFLSALKGIITSMFTEWEGRRYLPVHGSGAVAERKVRGIIMKNDAFYTTAKLQYLYREDSLFLENETGSAYAPRSKKLVRPYPKAARLKFVPKDLNNTRSICMEPIPHQWAQQGVRLWYETALLQGWGGNHIPLHEQEVNADAAQYGALTGRVDTIDLSSASDSVSWDIVKNIFPAKVLKHLHATRSDRVELPSGETIKVRKFAPMGSALCFPVQSTLYLAVVFAVGVAWRFGQDIGEIGDAKHIENNFQTLYELTFARSLGKGSDRLLEPMYIYGDDIVCDSRITSKVIDVLELLGFQVNVAKSFTGDSAFRESCGGYYLGGRNVTPLRYKVKKFTQKISIDSMASVIDLANRAGEWNYQSLRRHAIQFILHYPILGLRTQSSKNPILFTDDEDESMSILCSEPRNRHLEIRRPSDGQCAPYEFCAAHDPNATSKDVLKWERRARGDSCYDYQRTEIRSITAGPREKRRHSSKEDAYHYVAWWRNRFSDQEELGDYPERSERADTVRTGVRWRWTPTA